MFFVVSAPDLNQDDVVLEKNDLMDLHQIQVKAFLMEEAMNEAPFCSSLGE